MSQESEVDAALLERCRNGEVEACDALYERHSDIVIRFFRNKVRTRAEDLVHETFTRLFERLDHIREPRALRSYLLGIARYVLIEHLREIKRDRALDPEVESAQVVEPGLSSIAARRREHRLLLEGLRRLPINDQITLELHFWERLKSPDIAAIMGISASGIRSRIATATARLNMIIAELAESAPLIASTAGDLDEWADEIRARLAHEDGDASE